MTAANLAIPTTIEPERRCRMMLDLDDITWEPVRPRGTCTRRGLRGARRRQEPRRQRRRRDPRPPSDGTAKRIPFGQPDTVHVLLVAGTDRWTVDRYPHQRDARPGLPFKAGTKAPPIEADPLLNRMRLVRTSDYLFRPRSQYAPRGLWVASARPMTLPELLDYERARDVASRAAGREGESG